ncbi:MAG: phosphomannomutase/phosphoglucomutase [Phycisphaerae bacterium]
MAAKGEQNYQRFCPGEEHIKLSEAVCIGRRKANFHKCPGCQFNDDEKGRAKPSGPLNITRMRSTTLTAVKEELMLEKVFKAYDVRATVPDLLNEEIAWRIGNGTAQFLRTLLTGYDRSDDDMNTLIIGRDMRKSSPSLTRAFIEGAAATGTRIIDIGMIDTSQIYFATNHLKCCGGVQVTASHNPPNYNGFKICGPKGKPVGADSGLKEIERIAKAISRHKGVSLENVRTMDLSTPYRAYLRKFLVDPRPMTIVVDASNGMAGRWFPIIFSELPNLRVIPLNFEHAGDFVHPPNPLVESNLDQMRAAVKEHNADFGACFDGDADRCILVDENGKTIRCDLLTALLAVQYLRRNPGAAVVYDLRSSRIVKDVVTNSGGIPRRQRVGHVFMKRAMAEAGGIVGGELSGHFYFRDFYNCDSGFLALIAVMNIMTETNQSLSALMQPFERYASSGERNFENPDKDGTLQKILAKYRDADIDQLDGVTVQYPTWWFNIRASNTEPLMRLNLEADTPQLVEAKLAELAPLLGKQVDH